MRDTSNEVWLVSREKERDTRVGYIARIYASSDLGNDLGCEVCNFPLVTFSSFLVANTLSCISESCGWALKLSLIRSALRVCVMRLSSCVVGLILPAVCPQILTFKTTLCHTHGRRKPSREKKGLAISHYTIILLSELCLH